MQQETEQMSDKRLSIRVTEAELQRVDRLVDTLQERIRAETAFGRFVRVGQKTVIMEALDLLEKELGISA